MKNEEQHEYQFRGCWFPPVLMDMIADKKVSLPGAVLLMLVDSLCRHGGKDCWASNEYLGKRLGLSGERVRKIISELRKSGLLIQTGFDGRSRFLSTAWSNPGGQPGRKRPVGKVGNDHQRIQRENTSPSQATGGIELAPLGGGGKGDSPQRGGKAPPPTSRKFQEKFFEMYLQTMGKPYLGFNGHHGKALKELHLALEGSLSRFKKILTKFFADDDPFLVKNGYSIPVLLSRINQYTEEDAPEVRVGTHTVREDDGSAVSEWGD